MSRVSTFDPDDREVDGTEETNAVDGSVEKSDEEKFMHSLITGGDEEIQEGRLVSESINQGITSFNPDVMFKQLVSDFKRAERLYGETVIKQVTGYDADYVKKNTNIPEFRQEMHDAIQERVHELEDRGVLEDGKLTDKAVEIHSVIMYLEELDKLVLQGGGESQKRRDRYGDTTSVRPFDHDRYRDFALRKSVRQAIRRGHETIRPEDMRAFNREREGRISVIYGMDASGSMKGEKIGMAKRAGVALSHKAVNENNEVGLVVFGTGVKRSVAPCQDVESLLQTLASVSPGRETNIADTIDRAVELFPDDDVVKHFVLLSDALPTKGSSPVDDTVEAVVRARDEGVTVSVVGINLNEEGRDVAEQIVEEGGGRLYAVDTAEDVDVIVLEDYEQVRRTL